MKRFFITVLLVHALSLSVASAEETVRFEPAEVALTGKLLGSYVMLSSGEMLKGKILHLNDPITVEGNESSQNRDSRRTVRNIQQILVEFEMQEPADDVLGSVVELKGLLYNEPSDPYHTKILMKAASLRIIEEMSGGPVATVKTHRE